MRIDGPSQRSYPIKRKPGKAPVVVPQPPKNARSSGSGQAVSTANVPARPQDIIFPRSMSSRVANALASYLSTASFVDWDLEVSGLDVHV
jgi:hypothetical protein